MYRVRITRMPLKAVFISTASSRPSAVDKTVSPIAI